MKRRSELYRTKVTETAIKSPRAMMNLETLRAMMNESGIDGLVLSSPDNILYSTGIDFFGQRIYHVEAYAIVSANSSTETMLVLPSFERYVYEESKTWVKPESVKWHGRFYVRDEPEAKGERVGSPTLGLISALEELGLVHGNLAIEFDSFNLSTYETVKWRLPQVRFVNGRDLIGKLRSVKNEDEIRLIRETAELTDKIVTECVQRLKSEITEIELEHRLTSRLAKEGMGILYTQIGFGERSAMTEVIPSSRKLKKADLVRVNVGTRRLGYCADIGRTFAFQDASTEFRRIYKVLSEAQHVARVLASPGIKASQLYEEAVKVPVQSGIADYTRHHVGYGIGLSLYEPPVLRADNDAMLEENMVFNIETPYFIWERAAFIPKDTFVLKSSGCEPITQPVRELPII